MPGNRSKPAHPVRPVQLQRKSACTCGGGCPRCNAAAEADETTKLQKKLNIGASNDPLEQEADRVADQVMATSLHSAVSSAPPRIQRFAGSASEASNNSAPASVERVLAGSAGRPLEASMQEDMGQRFGNDFSDVRVHSGAAAEKSARDVHANAYTVGNNIVFGANQYSPDTQKGKRLLAHELTHVVQQSRGGSPVLARQPADGEDEVFKAMMEMPQWQRDQMLRHTDAFKAKTFQAPVVAPEPKSAPAEDVGCHKDPYARSGDPTACSGGHHQKEDDATRATRKAMQQPNDDFKQLEIQQRARFDRLNAAYFEWQRTGKYIHRNEFSPYEIEKDNEFSVKTRWDLSMRAHGVDPNNLESVQFDEHYFVSKDEYKVELYAREAKYKQDFKACKKDRGPKLPKLSRKHPEYIDCQNRVDAKYYPRGAAWQDAARRATYRDMQVAGPVVTQSGFLASAGYTFAHEVLGWDVDKSASFGGALSTLGGMANAKIQQTLSNRNLNQNVVPPQGMTPPPANVAPAPDKKPIPAPGASPQVAAPTTSTPPPMTMPRQLDLSQKLQTPPAVTVTPPKTPAKVTPPTVAPKVTPPVVQPVKPVVGATTGATPPKVVIKPITPDDIKKLGIDAEAPLTLTSADFSKAKLAPGQDALYIVRDADGTVLKVGKTSETAITGRLRVYKNAEKLEGRTIQVEIYPLKPSKQKAETFEAALRKKMVGDGHAMPWDNTGNRLGRPGFGTPGEGARTPPVTMEKLKELLILHKGNRREVGKALAKLLGRDSVHQRTVGMWAQALGLKTTDFK